MAKIKDRPNNKGQEEKPIARYNRLKKWSARKWNSTEGKVAAHYSQTSINKAMEKL